MGERLVVQRAGLAWLQDLGRVSASRYGVSANGAADQYSARAANALVGKDQGAALVEVTASPFAFTSSCEVAIAVTGADAIVTVSGKPIAQWHTAYVPSGGRVDISDIHNGLHCYVAVRAALEIDDLLLGSVAPDRALGYGRMLSNGDEVVVSPIPGRPEVDSLLTSRLRPRYGSPWTLNVCVGPDWSVFEEVRESVLCREFAVDAMSNHVGIRLRSDLPVLQMPDELSSRGVAIGSVEITPSRELVILHRGRSITAGYPIIAVVTSDSLSAAGQVRTGDRVRFNRVSVHAANEIYRQRRRVLDNIEAAASRS